MGKIIINYDDDLGFAEAITAVNASTIDGKISVTSNGVEHYCWVTVFKDCVVHTLKKKKGQTSDSFRVVRKNKKEILR